jgi:hypothetical protein
VTPLFAEFPATEHLNRFKVRAYEVGAVGFLTQADGYKDYEFTVDESLEDFAKRLSRDGFLDPERRRWIMPGSIVWVEQENEAT